MRLFTVVVKNCSRRRTRSLLTVSGIAVAVGAVVALVGIARGFERSLLSAYESRGVDLMVVRAGSMQRLSSTLEESLGQRIRALPGVRDVSPVLADAVSFEDLDLFGVVIQGYPLDSYMLPQMKIIDGLPMAPQDRRAVWLGKVTAQNLQKSPGDTLEMVDGNQYLVAGIYQSFNVFENGAMVMAMHELQELMDRQGVVTAFCVRLRTDRNDGASVEEIGRQIKALAPGLEALPTKKYVDTAVEIRMARSVAWLISTIALVIGAIGMLNTMLMAVFERTGEIALLRAIGWRKFSVIRLILLESLLLGLAGAALGTLGAVGLTQLLSRLPASGRMVSGQIAPSVILQGVAIAMLVAVLGGIYPAWRAARLLPTEGLRRQ